MTAENPPASAETPEPIWSIWLGLSFMMLWAVLMVVIQIGSMAAAAILSTTTSTADFSQEAAQAFTKRFVEDINASPYAVFGFAACALLAWMITFGLIEMFFRTVPRPVLGRALGLKPPVPRWSMPAAAAAGIAASLAGLVIAEVLSTESTSSPFDEALKTVPGFIGLCVFALLIAPAAEETFFRGFLFPPLRRQFSPGVAVLVNAAVFAAVHLMTYNGPDAAAFLIPVMLLGIVAASFREWTGSVIPGIVAHLLFNGTQLFLFLRSDAAPF